MEWSGEGLIIGVRRHGESGVIVEAMVEGRGRHLGLLRGGRSSRYAATLQPGNSVQLTWRARLEDHLGNYALEITRARAAALMADRTLLYASQLLCEHLRLLPERDPHDRLLDFALHLLDNNQREMALGAALVRFELNLLEELGFGLDLETCALTGARDNLIYVSPKTGRAASREAGEPYKDKLLALPGFMVGGNGLTVDDLSAGFRLTGHFLADHVWIPRRIDPPATRDRLIETLVEAL
jgi:DNA repair protein RecO (recombination protein O)